MQGDGRVRGESPQLLPSVAFYVISANGNGRICEISQLLPSLALYIISASGNGRTRENPQLLPSVGFYVISSSNNAANRGQTNSVWENKAKMFTTYVLSSHS